MRMVLDRSKRQQRQNNIPDIVAKSDVNAAAYQCDHLGKISCDSTRSGLASKGAFRMLDLAAIREISMGAHMEEIPI